MSSGGAGAAHLPAVSSHSDRPKTISASGEIVPKPYGPSRWASPRRYACGHTDCPGEARILVTSGTHPIDDQGATKTHNCCGAHGAA